MQQDSTDVTAALRLFDLAPRITRLENAVLAESDPSLTFRQFRLLTRIAEGLNTITQLGRIATISLPAISESVEGLVRKGLVVRTTDTNDRRAVNLALTEAGERARAIGGALLAEAAADLLSELSSDARRRLAEDLEVVSERVANALLADREA